jgi:hypothetical protein
MNSAITTIWSGIGMISAMNNMLKFTQTRPRVAALISLSPFVICSCLLANIFYESQWAMKHPGFIFIMSTPAIVMVVQK